MMRSHHHHIGHANNAPPPSPPTCARPFPAHKKEAATASVVPALYGCDPSSQPSSPHSTPETRRSSSPATSCTPSSSLSSTGFASLRSGSPTVTFCEAPRPATPSPRRAPPRRAGAAAAGTRAGSPARAARKRDPAASPPHSPRSRRSRLKSCLSSSKPAVFAYHVKCGVEVEVVKVRWDGTVYDLLAAACAAFARDARTGGLVCGGRPCCLRDGLAEVEERSRRGGGPGPPVTFELVRDVSILPFVAWARERPYVRGLPELCAAVQAAPGDRPAALRVQLSGHTVGDRGALLLAETLASGRCPESLELLMGSTHVGDAGVAALAAAATTPGCPRHLCLQLRFNRVTDDGALDVAELLGRGERVTAERLVYDLGFNGVGAEAAAALEAASSERVQIVGVGSVGDYCPV